MAKFVLVKRISLDKLGNGWDGCFVEMNSIAVSDLAKLASYKVDGDGKKATDDLMELIKTNFVSGLGWNGKEKIEINKEDIGDLPVEVLGVISENFFQQPSTEN